VLTVVVVVVVVVVVAAADDLFTPAAFAPTRVFEESIPAALAVRCGDSRREYRAPLLLLLVD
jgi:hypothetical protein